MRRNAHLIATGILLCALFPILRAANLPLRFTWREFFLLYWGAFAVQSLFLAILLYAIDRPRELVRAISRPSSKVPFPFSELKAIFIPAAYFFLTFFLVLCYNDIIAAYRFDGSADRLLATIDRTILAGYTVPQLAHFAALHWKPWLLEFLEVIYFGMFPQIGACIILLAMQSGLKESFKFVGCLATAYYLALILFYAFPATGPYYGCETHLAAWRGDLTITKTQLIYTHALNIFKAHGRPTILSADYFIAIPCMHVAQPMIVMWFLRRWKQAFRVLLAYGILLVASILILEQHYVIDLMAGAVVAVVSVVAVDWPRWRKEDGSRLV